MGQECQVMIVICVGHASPVLMWARDYRCACRRVGLVWLTHGHGLGSPTRALIHEKSPISIKSVDIRRLAPETGKRKKGPEGPFFNDSKELASSESEFGAGNETRTRDPDLGKVVLYQLSYSRVVLVTGAIL